MSAIRHIAAASQMWWNIKNLYDNHHGTLWIIQIQCSQYVVYRHGDNAMTDPLFFMPTVFYLNLTLRIFPKKFFLGSFIELKFEVWMNPLWILLVYCVVSDMDHLLSRIGDWKMGHMCAILSFHNPWLFHRIVPEDSNNISVKILCVCLISIRFCSN